MLFSSLLSVRFMFSKCVFLSEKGRQSYYRKIKSERATEKKREGEKERVGERERKKEIKTETKTKTFEGKSFYHQDYPL